MVRMVQDIKEYLLKACSPLKDQVVLKNILTRNIVTNVAVDKLLCYIIEGNAAYAKFISYQLRKNAFDTLNYK